MYKIKIINEIKNVIACHLQNVSRIFERNESSIFSDPQMPFFYKNKKHHNTYSTTKLQHQTIKNCIIIVPSINPVK